MSSKNNVNKDFYTLAGRDRPNEVVMEAKHRPDDVPGHRGGAQPNFIPGAAPVGESPAPAPDTEPTAAEGASHAQTSAEKTGTRSGSQKKATARRGGKTPGQARPNAGASGDTVKAKRGAARTETARRSRRRAA